MTYTIIRTDWQTNKLSLKKIRDLVFIQEQAVPVADEWDGKDEAATHFLVQTVERKAVACARLLMEHHAGENLFHIGRVAVLSEYRNQHIGRELMQAIIVYCKDSYPQNEIYLHAQKSRQRFYERLGFAADGEIFMDAGIPHIKMWLSPPSQDQGNIV